ncbi:MAG: hypothetical protein C4297_01110 [Gemmataceae bacterium]
MRVCLVSWAPFYAGAEVAGLRLAQGLIAAGHEVLVVLGTDGEVRRRFQEAGLAVHYVPQQFTDKWHWLRYRRARNALMRLLRAWRPDLVHSNDLPTHQMSSDAARRLGIPRVCHHRWIFEASAIDWLNKYGAERHLFVSRYLRDTLCDRSQMLRRQPGEVVYDGLPLPPTPSEQERLSAKHRLDLAGRLVVLFAGQVIERKGVADLLHAWAQICPRWQDRAALVVVGDDLENQGAYREKMEKLARALGVAVRFTGFQKNVPQWLTAADVVVVPSHAEPLGNATLEAMAHGRPVIGSRVGGIPEMIVHGQTGLLVEPQNPEALAHGLEKLLADDQMRHALGCAARQRCEHLFSLDRHVQHVLEQYRAVLGNCTRAGAVT